MEKEKADRLGMYDDLADELKPISKAIAETKLRLHKWVLISGSDPGSQKLQSNN